MNEEYLIQAEILHDEAMELADDAFLAKSKGDDEAVFNLLNQAAEKEIQAANYLPPEKSYEPSRSILFRSAAHLAYDAGDYKLADRLVASGLSGFPPPDVESELKNFYENINFMRNLESSGKEIADDSFVFMVEGEDTFFGGVLIHQVTNRLEDLQAIFYHTVSRMLGIEFGQERLSAAVKKEYAMYLDAQLAGSYGVYVRIGAPIKQPSLFADNPEFAQKDKSIEISDLISEIVDCLDMWEKTEFDDLQERINDRKYFENFVAIAKKMAPDGKAIKTVAIASSNKTREHPVFLRKSKKTWRDLIKEGIIPEAEIDTTKTSFVLRGKLRHANTPKRGEYGTVKLDDLDTGKTNNIKVSLTLMKDTVQPFYEEDVEISGYIQDEKYYLMDIDELSELYDDTFA